MTKPIKSHIPEELIEEILINLAVEPLLRFKCVSKSWRRLISDKSFAKAHLQKSSDFIDRHNLMYKFYHRNRWSLRSCSLKYLLDGQQYDAVPAWDHGPIGDHPKSIEILGSCNGLILVSDRKRSLLLWNPKTRVFHPYLTPNHNFQTLHYTGSGTMIRPTTTRSSAFYTFKIPTGQISTV